MDQKWGMRGRGAAFSLALLMVQTGEIAAQELAPSVNGAPVTESAAQAPLPVLDPMAEGVKLALASLDRTGMNFVEKRRFAAVAGFYEQRDYRPAFVADGKVTEKARLLLARLEAAGADGLDPARFAIPAVPETAQLETLAAFEIALAHAGVAFAEEASGGRVDPSSINKKFITRQPERVDPIAALTAIDQAADVAAMLEVFNPPHEGFRRLKAKLAEVRLKVDAPKPEPIAEGKTLKPGMSDPRVPALRVRLSLPAEADPLLAEVYDEALVEAVKAFQKTSGLLNDGIIGPRTLAMLNGENRDEEGEILANMEMWRWMPRDLGTDYVLVNIPEFMVRVVRHGLLRHETRVVVGTPHNQTPVFSDEMEYLVVNPYWHVPESIRAKEMLPEIKADPVGFFRRHGYQALWNGEVVDPASIIWDENAAKYVSIRQQPGDANALGNIKFMFPNKHAVYLHDTPSRRLFERDYRAYSHGCVRVHEPMVFAGAILEGESRLDVPTLESMFGQGERQLDLEQRLHVHIAYFNAWVDDHGVLQIRDDLYGHTAKVKKALRG